MNPHGNLQPSLQPPDVTAPPPFSPPDPYNSSHHRSLSATLPSPPLVQTAHRYLTVLNLAPYQASLRQDGGQNMVLSSGSFTSPLPASGQGLGRRSGRQSSAAPVPPNTYPAHSYQVSVIIPSPDLRLSPHRPQCSEDSSPDLECSICFSQFNNVFRCPKMLQCKHTFCLECLARINVKSAQPSAIQCPLCRSLTLLPALGLPRLATDSDVLAYLPAPMQRVYSIRFHRNKGKLQVKRSSEGHRRWGQRSANRSLDVGLPSPSVEGRSGASGVGGALFRLTGRPLCRAFLLTSVVMMMVLLTGIVIFLLTFRGDPEQ